MRFLHTADWHLGKRLHDFPLLEVQRELVAGLIDLVKDERPDAVLVAGDVFDTLVPQIGALELWEAAVDGIVGELGVPMIVIPGNHDHADRLAVHAGLAKKAGLHYIRSLKYCEQPVVIGGVAFYGMPFHKPVHVNAAFRDDKPGITDFDYAAAMSFALERVRRARTPNMPAVLLAHAFVDGAGSEPEGEDAIQVGGAGGISKNVFDGFDYVALGHIHGARRIGERQLYYSGSIYPYSFSEARQADKTVRFVELDASGKVVMTEEAKVAARRKVTMIEDQTFEEILRSAESLPRHELEHYTLVRVTDREPLENALARLREWYPHAVLEQPEIEVNTAGPRLVGDYKSLSVEDAFRQFYRDTFDDELVGVEEEVLLNALGADDGEDVAVDPSGSAAGRGDGPGDEVNDPAAVTLQEAEA